MVWVGIGVEFGCWRWVAAGRVEEGESEGVVSAVGAERVVGRRRKRVKKAMMFFMVSGSGSRLGPQVVVSCIVLAV